MRFAVPAVASISGLLLLGLAFFGDPPLYFQQARDHWDALFAAPAVSQTTAPAPDTQAANQPPATAEDTSAASQPTTTPVPDTFAASQPEAVARDASSDATGQARLQQEVTRLEAELAAKQTPPPQTEAPAPSRPAATQAPEPAPAHAVTAETKPPTARTPEPAPANAPATEPTPATVIKIPERHEAAAAEPVLPPPEPPKSPPQEHAARAKAPPPPPLPPAQQGPTQLGQDTRSVLARLRQLAQGPEHQPDATSSIAPAPPPSAALPGLTAANVALADGRIEDARRLLQEAQLRLVFRPIDAPGDEPRSEGRGADDVAKALEAISANNIPLSRRYIRTAMTDLSGTGTEANPPPPNSNIDPTGYAPAYPPR